MTSSGNVFVRSFGMVFMALVTEICNKNRQHKKCIDHVIVLAAVYDKMIKIVVISLLLRFFLSKIY